MCNIHEYAWAMMEFGINSIVIGSGWLFIYMCYRAIKEYAE
jgi:hypothetical protein